MSLEESGTTGAGTQSQASQKRKPMVFGQQEDDIPIPSKGVLSTQAIELMAQLKAIQPGRSIKIENPQPATIRNKLKALSTWEGEYEARFITLPGHGRHFRVWRRERAEHLQAAE